MQGGRSDRTALGELHFRGHRGEQVFIRTEGEEHLRRGLASRRVLHVEANAQSSPRTAPTHQNRVRRRIAAVMKDRLAKPAAVSAAGPISVAKLLSPGAGGRVAVGHPSYYHRLVCVIHCRVSVGIPVRCVGARPAVGRACCGRRPVVWSVESGSATRIPASWRPLSAALTATRASLSAVAAPADTPSTATVVRILSVTRGVCSSTTEIRIVSPAARLVPGGGLVSDGYLEVPRPFRLRRLHPGARGPQGGRGVRVLLRADHQVSADSQRGGEDRQLRPEGQRTGVGSQRQDGE